MTRLTRTGLVALLLSPVLLMGGCGGLTIDLGNGVITVPGVGVVTIELINDTDYYVDPHIVFDDDDNFLAGWFPAEELGVHDLAPGEVYSLDIDCDNIGVVYSNEPEQFVTIFTYTANQSRILVRDDDYDCGDVITFQFLGNADGFDVVVAVNGVVVD
ncbi:MAG: hypothetical protein PVJ57_02855 [Phycisphaerae bacterium]